VEEVLAKSFIEWIREDCPYWDITTEALVPQGITVEAEVQARSEGVVACTSDIARILRSLGFSVRDVKPDGSRVKPSDCVMVIRGDARKLLLVERTMLNLLMYCSGIATATRRIVEMARKQGSKTKIAATRKTAPGLRYFAKRAVIAGSGDPHRLGLSDMVLIKDNHVKIVGSVGEAVRKARAVVGFSKKIEVEVNSVEEAVEAAEAGADIVMLDNFKPESVARAIAELEKRGLRDKILVEVSGGITPDNIEKYLELGVDIISLGWITHSAPAIDLSLEIVEVIR